LDIAVVVYDDNVRERPTYIYADRLRLIHATSPILDSLPSDLLVSDFASSDTDLPKITLANSQTTRRRDDSQDAGDIGATVLIEMRIHSAKIY
jgi:hypothetical protein